MRRLEFSQELPVPVEQAWEFFSDPANLSRITPPGMGFIVTSKVPARIYPGLIITYRVSPLWGIPVKWVTEITHVNEPFYFVDEQRSGPYAIWHHEHHFQETETGVRMTDRLFYKVPFGLAGRLADAMLVYPRVMAIFSFRERTLAGHPLFQPR